MAADDTPAPPPAPASPPPASVAGEDTRGWLVVQFFDEDGHPMMARVKQYEAGFPRADYPHRINVFWPAAAATEDGVPAASELEAMAVFENHLCAALEPDAQASLCLVVTGGGEREWVFQTRDPHEFLRRLSAMPHGEDRYPVELEHEEDPTWSLFDEYRPDDEDADGAPPGVTVH